MANYPGSLPSLGTKTDNVDNVAAADYNNLAGEITAVATELGTDVAGDQTDLKTRLANSLSDSGHLEFAQETLLTIASGEITVTQNLHRVETEGGAGSDNLDTINGEVAGAFIILRASDDTHTVVIKDGTGNIETTGGADITLDVNSEFAFGYYDGTLSKWLMSRAVSGGVTLGSGDANYLALWSDSETLASSGVYWLSPGLTIGTAEADTDYQFGVDGETNDGYFTWMEDEDYWSFDDGIMIPAGEQIYFRDTAIHIASGDDGHLDLTADTSIDLNGVTLATDKIAFTQTDGNENIDSANDGYLDYTATTAHRFRAATTETDVVLQFIGTTTSGQVTWMEDEDRFDFADDVVLLGDNEGVKFGAGVDMSIYYDGAAGNIDTDLVAASDLTIDCGTAKTVVLEVPVYQDANIGSLVLQTGGTLPGIVQILDKDGDATGIYTRGFDVGEQGSGVIEMPHDYKEGTDIVFHVHWGSNTAPSGTDQVAWQLTYAISRDSNTFPDAVTPAAGDTAYDTQYEWLRTDVATITGSTGGVGGGNILIGDQFHFTLTRVAAAGDAFAGEALVATIGFHYQVDTLGSRQIGTK